MKNELPCKKITRRKATSDLFFWKWCHHVIQEMMESQERALSWDLVTFYFSTNRNYLPSNMVQRGAPICFVLNSIFFFVHLRSLTKPVLNTVSLFITAIIAHSVIIISEIMLTIFKREVNMLIFKNVASLLHVTVAIVLIPF